MKGDYGGDDIYKEARNLKRRSIKLGGGPSQREVAIKYASAAEQYLEENNFAMAGRMLKEIKEFTDDPELIKIVKNKLPEKRGIEKRFIFVILSVITLILALFFTSVSLTGYSVFELTQNNSRFIGTGLFILGLTFSFLYFKLK